MRFHCLFAVGSVFVAAFCFADTKSDIQARYTKLEAAMRAKSPTKVMELCSADFKWLDSKGTSMDRKQLEQQIKMQLSAVQKIDTMTNKIEKLTVKGNTVIARTNGVFEATLKLTPDAKKTSRLKSVSLTDDTWIKTPKGWLLKQVKSIKETVTLDGKPFGG